MLRLRADSVRTNPERTNHAVKIVGAPQYHADYYCAFVLDPDGHRIEAVCHAPESPIIQAAGGRALPSEIENVTAKTRDAAIELLVRFFREGGFSTPRSRIAENFDRMLADPLCWSALAADGETTQAVITVSTVLTSNGIAWARSAISTCIPWHVALSNTPRLGAVPRAVRRSPSPSRQQASGGMGSVNSTPGSASRSPVE